MNAADTHHDDIALTHTSAEGTLCEGTSKGDGSAAILTAHGFRWSRHLGAWFLPRSRERAPQTQVIEAVAGALRTAGWSVGVEVDPTVEDPAVVAERRAQRAQDRAERHERQAQTHEAKARQREQSYRQIADAIPLGQPILLGHHSQRRAECDRDRMQAHVSASVEHDQRARHHHEAAARARHDAAGPSALSIARKIDRLGAEVRKLERQAQSQAHTGPAWERLSAHLARQCAELDYLSATRREQIAAGVVIEYGPHNVVTGDLVQIRGTWHRVARTNKKTVAVESGHSWTNTTPWYEVNAHRARPSS